MHYSHPSTALLNQISHTTDRGSTDETHYGPSVIDSLHMLTTRAKRRPVPSLSNSAPKNMWRGRQDAHGRSRGSRAASGIHTPINALPVTKGAQASIKSIVGERLLLQRASQLAPCGGGDPESLPWVDGLLSPTSSLGWAPIKSSRRISGLRIILNLDVPAVHSLHS